MQIHICIKFGSPIWAPEWLLRLNLHNSINSYVNSPSLKITVIYGNVVNTLLMHPHQDKYKIQNEQKHKIHNEHKINIKFTTKKKIQ